MALRVLRSSSCLEEVRDVEKGRGEKRRALPLGNALQKHATSRLLHDQSESERVSLGTAAVCPSRTGRRDGYGVGIRRRAPATRIRCAGTTAATHQRKNHHDGKNSEDDCQATILTLLPIACKHQTEDSDAAKARPKIHPRRM